MKPRNWLQLPPAETAGEAALIEQTSQLPPGTLAAQYRAAARAVQYGADFVSDALVLTEAARILRQRAETVAAKAPYLNVAGYEYQANFMEQLAKELG